ncbi:MAG TPA: DUF1801 domain-containing protein [Mariniphaga sp.]|nr:DUF1801 domain-containing protein [Mariniphaga sp.]
MKNDAVTPDSYIEQLAEDRREAFSRLRKTILDNLPKGFSEEKSYGMIGYVIPKSLYPEGYHANPNLPLPFINIASQKKFIALYHMGIYADTKLLSWFLNEYSKYSNKKPDMGKSCIRFKKPDEIPFELIGQLSAKLTPLDWIDLYEKSRQ